MRDGRRAGGAQRRALPDLTHRCGVLTASCARNTQLRIDARLHFVPDIGTMHKLVAILLGAIIALATLDASSAEPHEDWVSLYRKYRPFADRGDAQAQRYL